jgi:hypothetical protein
MERTYQKVCDVAASVARNWGIKVVSEVVHEHTDHEYRTYKAFVTQRELEEIYDSLCP